MPAITTAWPWPGVTACALLKSAVRWAKSSPTSGAQEGSEAFCWVKIHSVITIAATVRTTIAIVSLPRPRDCRESEARKWRQRLTFGLRSLIGSPPSGWARRPGRAGR